MGLFSHTQNIGYTRLHLFRKDWTVKKIRLRIYELVRPLIKGAIGNKQLKENDLEKEYDYMFLDSKGQYNIDNNYYDIEIKNNIPVDQSMFSRQPACDFCG